MAEIKSTMELVMERAARMGKATSEEMEQDIAKKQGMQLIAAFLDDKEESPESPTKILARQEPARQTAIRQGMAETLLRNLFLPRDEQAQERTELATKGLLDLAAGAGDIVTICQEMQHIIGQYRQHREQLRGQLEEQMRMQYEQVMAQQAGGQTEGMNIDPTTQPKFQEEWAKLEAELDAQYNQALAQHREQLKQRMGVV
jgi:CubicO group peptidase (beta-lactamase class C family)